MPAFILLCIMGLGALVNVALYEHRKKRFLATVDAMKGYQYFIRCTEGDRDRADDFSENPDYLTMSLLWMFHLPFNIGKYFQECRLIAAMKLRQEQSWR